jgi:hypothetical protein
MLADTSAIRIDRIPTPLTGYNRSIARPTRLRKTDGRPTLAHCNTCGGEVGRGRTQCDACLPQVKAAALERFVSGAHSELAARREIGDDPAHGGEAGRKRGNSNRQHQLEITEWEKGNDRSPPSAFLEEILPGLQTVSIQTMAQATGLTAGYCSFIRRGIHVPHERHWEVPLQLASRVEPGTKGSPRDQ